MDAPRFPLMRLQIACFQNVLRIMNPIQLFGIPLSSKRTKGLVQSLRIKASKFTVVINNGYSINMRFSNETLYFVDFQSIVNLRELSVEYGDIKFRWSLNEMDGRTFISHLKFIFNTEKVSIEFGVNTQDYDFESVLKGRRDIGSINLMADNQEENQRILNIMQPSTVLMNNIISRDILLQNFDFLVVRAWNFSLNELLLMSSRRFEAACRMISANLLNRFLILWMRGSNPKLENLVFCSRIDDGFTEEVMLNGLKTTQNVEVRYFKSAERTFKLTGGSDIFRFDGTMATIRAHCYSRLLCRFELFVWHDHCVAKETDL